MRQLIPILLAAAAVLAWIAPAPRVAADAQLDKVYECAQRALSGKCRKDRGAQEPEGLTTNPHILTLKSGTTYQFHARANADFHQRIALSLSDDHENALAAFEGSGEDDTLMFLTNGKLERTCIQPQGQDTVLYIHFRYKGAPEGELVKSQYVCYGAGEADPGGGCPDVHALDSEDSEDFDDNDSHLSILEIPNSNSGAIDALCPTPIHQTNGQTVIQR